MQELMNLDSTFSVSTFLTKVDNIYVMLCTSLMTNNLDRVNHFIGDDLYRKMSLVLADLNSNNVIQMYDELNVKSSSISDVKIYDDRFEITVTLVSRYMDYKIDKNTRNVVSGNNNSRIEKVNTLLFVKKRNSSVLGSVRTCPRCGAGMDLNSTGVCSYCGGIFEQDNHDWILVDIN